MRREQQRAAVRSNTARRRKRRRKRSYILYYIMLFLFVGIAFITLSVTVFFNVENIVVEGEAKISEQEIIKQAGIEKGDNLFRINYSEAEDKVLNVIKDIDKVSVKRELPSTVKIVVSETQPYLNVKLDSGYVILSKNYRVMRTDSSPDLNAVTLSGVDIEKFTDGDFVDINSVEKYDIIEQINDELKNNDIDKIKEIDVSNIVNITLNYDNKYQILLGGVTELSYKLKFVKQVISKNLSPDEKGVIDARQSGQVSFREDDDIYSQNKSDKNTSSGKTDKKRKQKKNNNISSNSSN